MLHDFHLMDSAMGAERPPASQPILPAAMRLWLYRWALDRAHLDTILDRFAIHSLVWLSHAFARLDGAGLRRPRRRREKVALAMARRGGD
jgi:hypothetical protein